jgi:hypothetical protein
LTHLARLPQQPPDLANRLRAILYPPPSAAIFEEQRNGLLTLIDEVDRLATAQGYAADRWVGLA